MDNSEGGIKRKSRVAVFEHVVEKQKNPKSKKFQPNRLDLGDSSPSESELVIDDKEEPVKKKRNLLIKLTEEPLDLQCEWSFCDETFDSWEKFNMHLTDHATVESEHLICQWKDCDSQPNDLSLFIQHISFHGYLSKLKNIGRNVVSRNNLPKCTLKENLASYTVHPDGYMCEWEYCFLMFYSIYDFYTHMEIHIKNNPKKCKENSGETIACEWKGCNTKYSTQYKLAEHVRTHTKEKIIACPTCCALFSNKTKFCDHRKRQLSTNLQSYQCSQCLKLSPSERLLRDHMRSHINHYKCTMCDMTCPRPSLLAKHMRFKHIKYKPFKCPNCTKTFVDRTNLVAHLWTHNEEDIMQCEQCDFKCRSKIGLENHLSRDHKKPSPIYECHCCKQKFKRGGYLTKHLMKRHNYHWPSGHSRFRYRKDQDGIFRLQTVRYESLEVTQEMIRSESMQTNNVLREESYELTYDNDGSSKYVLSVSENGAQSVKTSDSGEKNILITIDDVDEQGNIVKSQVVESTELVGTMIKSDIVITEHPLPDMSKVKVESDIESKCVEKTNNKRSLEVIQTKDCNKKSIKVEPKETKTDDIHYFSKDIIYNYDKFKIETAKSGY